MTYSELLRLLFQAGFTRVERDDRLLDIFPTEDREKGVELWECWQAETIRILRVRLPFKAEQLKLYGFSRTGLEALLQANTVSTLADYPLIAAGEAVATKI